MNSSTTPGDNREGHQATEGTTSSSHSVRKDVKFESDGPKQRRRQRVRRDPRYDAPLGGYNSSNSDDDSDTSSITSREARRRKKRREIRHRLYKQHKRDKLPFRLPFIKFLHSDAKNHVVAFMGEFVGTFMFLFFAFAGTQVANIGTDTAANTTTGASTGFDPGTLLYISLCFGFSLMVNAWIFFRISGGLFNPAVTLALWLLDALSAFRAVLLFIAQLTGACFAGYIVSVLFPTAFNVRTTLAPGTSIAQGIFIEAMGTAQLIFTIIMLAAEKHRASFLAPIGIGLALFIGELVAVYYTGGSFNPARSFAPCAVAHDFDGTHWIYWVGPLIGCLFAVGFYKLNKVLEYEMANPGQDGDVENDPTQNKDLDLAQIVEDRMLEVEVIRQVEEHEGGFDALSIATGDLGRDAEVMDADPVVAIEKGEGDLEKLSSAGGKSVSSSSGRRKARKDKVEDLEAGFGGGGGVGDSTHFEISDHLTREKDYNLMPASAK